MKLVQTPITGTERIQNLAKPYDALVEFYRAFNKGNFHLMAENWLQTADASMSNPLGGVKRGWDEIRTVYQNIFNGPADVYVEYYDYAIFDGEGFFHAVGRERGTLGLGGKTIDLKIRTSRTFVFSDGRFRQLHHHGSIEDAALLAMYQNTVLTGKIGQ